MRIHLVHRVHDALQILYPRPADSLVRRRGDILRRKADTGGDFDPVFLRRTFDIKKLCVRSLRKAPAATSRTSNPSPPPFRSRMRNLRPTPFPICEICTEFHSSSPYCAVYPVNPPTAPRPSHRPYRPRRTRGMRERSLPRVPIRMAGRSQDSFFKLCRGLAAVWMI